MREDIPDSEIHQRLGDGDPAASMLIAEKYLSGILDQLERRYPNLGDPALVEDAVHTAFINYFRRPDTYDPAKSSLRSFLFMAATGDLRNLLQQERRRQARQPVRMDVEDSEARAEYYMDHTTNPDRLDFDDSRLSDAIRNVLPDPIDQRMVMLMMDDERKTAVYAQVLGITALSRKEQEAVVKRHKDRIKKRLQRARIWTYDT